MGIIITSAETNRIYLRIECDALDDIFCRGYDLYEAVGYIEAHRAAMDAGWLERQSPRGRMWVCPRCSGKT